MHTDIHASSGIQTDDRSIRAGKIFHALEGAGAVIGKDDQIKDYKTTGLCSTHYNFVKYLVIKFKPTDPVGYICVGKRILLKYIFIE
jgi:hypothetical protein